MAIINHYLVWVCCQRIVDKVIIWEYNGIKIILLYYSCFPFVIPALICIRINSSRNPVFKHSYFYVIPV